MSLRYGRLFDSTVRTEYERALELAKQQTALQPPAGNSPAGRVQLPLADITGGKDWRTTPLLKSRMAGGFCLRAPARAPAATPTSANTAPATGPTLHPCRSSPPSASTPKRSPETQERGWIDEAERHHKLIARLDALIANTEATAG